MDSPGCDQGLLEMTERCCQTAAGFDGSFNGSSMPKAAGIASRLQSIAVIALLHLTMLLLPGCSNMTSPSEAEQLQLVDAATGDKDQESAIAALDAILKRQPEHPAALLYRAQYAHDVKDDAFALRLLGRIPDQLPVIASKARLLEGALALESNRAADAERLLRRAAELDDKSPAAFEKLTKLYALQRRRTDLQRGLESIRAIRPLTLNELALMVTASEQIWSSREAIRQLKTMVVNDSSDRASLYALGLYYYDDAQLSNAASAFETLLRTDSSHVLARAALARIRIDEQDPAAASEILRPIRFDQEQPPEAWTALAAYFVDRSEWRNAAGCLAEVIIRNPWDRTAFSHLAAVVTRMNEPQQAERLYLRAKRLSDLRDVMEIVGSHVATGKLNAVELLQVSERLRDLGESRLSEAWARLAAEYDSSLISIPDSARSNPKSDPVMQIVAKYQMDSTDFKGLLPGSTGMSRSDSEVPSPKLEFADQAASLELEFQYENGATGSKYMLETTGGGAGVIDYDGDLWPDLFFPQGGTLPPTSGRTVKGRLYRNCAGSKFLEVPVVSDRGDPWYGTGVAVGDLDSDGFDDLVVGNVGRTAFLQNQGDGTFRDITESIGILAEDANSSIGLADLDEDGLLDIFVVNYVNTYKICRNSRGDVLSCNPAHVEGVPSRLYRNLGNGHFVDVTVTSNIAPRGKGLGIVLADFNDDGKIDAFVSNDTSPNHLYINESSPGEIRLRETGLLAGVALGESGFAQAGMGIACADLNGDLRLDLYVTYFHHEANGLYLNEGGGLFRDATRASGLFEPTYELLGFGTQAIDCDNDGTMELVVANGHIDDRLDPGVAWKMPPQLFWRSPSGRYRELSRTAGPYFEQPTLGRTVAKLDWNRDRRCDLVFTHLDRPVAILTNQTPHAGNSLQLLLQGTLSNRNAIGASVRVSHRHGTQRADVMGGDGYRCTNSRWLDIGLGEIELIDDVEIRWPSGRVDHFSNVSPANPWIVIEGRDPVPLAQETAVSLKAGL